MSIFKNEIFDVFHTSYIIISILITVLVLYIAKNFIRKEKSKDYFLLFFSLSTFIIHLSPLWVSFLSKENPVATDNMLFPIYFCNLTMLMLLITSLKKDKTTKYYNFLAVSTAYSGIIGSIISLLYPDYYLSGNSGMTFGIFKSMLSHSTMLVGSLYLFIGGYIKVEEKHTKTFIYGLLLYGFIGLILNITFRIFGLPSPNAMYLEKSAIPEIPLLNGYVIAFILVIFVRYYNKIHLNIKEYRIKSKKLRLKH